MDVVNILFNKIIALLVKERLTGTCLLGSILFHEALKKRGISNKLQEGFFIVNDMYYAYHVWLIIDNKNYDVGLSVSIALNGGISKDNKDIFKLSTDEPKGIQRIDLDNQQENLEYFGMKQVYDNYLKNPKSYWKTMDKKYLRSWENK